MTVSQVMNANIWQLGELGAAGQLLVERSARHVELGSGRIPILAAIWPAIDPIHTLMNNTSDLVGTMLIARQLDKVDMNVYNS